MIKAPTRFLAVMVLLCVLGNSITSFGQAVRQSPDRNQQNASPGKIVGKVVDENGAGLSGASIKVVSAKTVTKTDAQGNFSLSLGSGTYTLDVTYVSYETKRSPRIVVEAGKVATVSITLQPSDNKLTDVVVTALGISKQKKQLGYATQVVKGEDISTAKSTNLFSALQGRVAGLNLSQASTGIANSSKITLRGESSLNFGSNQALIVVDGVPINNEIGVAVPQDVAVDYGSGGAEINPDDIESITVLKGPNAAALYGSRAAFGVIMIKTKSAVKSKAIGVSVTSSVVLDNPLKLPDFENEYGAGSGTATYYAYAAGPDGPANSNTNNSWGPKFNGQKYIQMGSPKDASGNYIPTPWEAQPDNVKNFFNTGVTFNNGVSLTKAGDMGDLRASYNYFKQKGILPNTGLERHQFNIKSKIKLSQKLTFDANVNYMNVSSDNLPVADYGNSPMYNLLFAQRNLDLSLLKDYWTPGKENVQQQHIYSFTDNPYLILYEELNGLKRNRVFGNIFLNYDISSHLSAMVRTGLDYTGDNRASRMPWSSTRAAQGLVRVQNRTVSQRNTDFLLTYQGRLPKEISYKASVGGNNLDIRVEDLANTGTLLVFPGVYNLKNAGTLTVTENNSHKTINSLYFLGSVSYKEQLFLDLTGRNDWSSTLPVANNSYFYPSVSVSAILSDMFHLKNQWLDYLKLRSSYASVGSDTDPYQTLPFYSYGSIAGTAVLPATIPNNDLKPEMNNSLEVGVEGTFFHNRLNVEVNYYNSNSVNQILRSPLPNSSGYTTRVFNAGKINNHGLEVSLNITPLKTKYLTWTMNLNGSANRSKIVELAEGVTSYNIASFNSLRNGASGFITATVGGSMGDMYGIGFQRSPEGKIIYSKGLPLLTTQLMKLGNYNPDFIAGISNTITYKGFILKFLFDGKFGGKIYSITHGLGSEFGQLASTLPGREEGIIGDGVVLDPVTGKYEPNTQKVTAYAYYPAYYKRPNVESNLFDATFIKLREVVLGYSLPKKWLGRTPLQSVRINLTGRNLLLFTKVPNIDPESVFFSSGSGIVPGVDNVGVPTTRSYGVNLQINL